jgi:hypothetical protein
MAGPEVDLEGRKMPDSVHTAVGQALGYVYQFERATYRLLEADVQSSA